MIALYLLAAHLLGDFVLQTRWQAMKKLDDFDHRIRHVCAYCVPFAPIAATAGTTLRAGAFLAWLFVLHFLTDTRRFYSTLGDVIAWRTNRNTRPLRLIPNPWPPVPIMIDQALHVAQLAVLGGIFLSP